MARLDRQRLVQGIDFGEFFFWDSDHPGDEEAVIAAIDQAHDGGRSVGCVDGIGVVLAPVQYGQAVVVVETWEEEPPLDLDDGADDLVDLDWVVSGHLVLEEPAAHETRVAVEPGRYRLRIGGHRLLDAAREFRETAYEDVPIVGVSTLASWSFRLWPVNHPSPLEYRRAWTDRSPS